MIKFGKNREVDSLYLNVPVKYILRYTGANDGGINHYRPETYEEWKSSMEEFLSRNPNLREFISLSKETYEYLRENGGLKDVLSKKAKDKTLCIVQFYGKKSALVAWRNNNTYKMGMTRLCKVVEKNGKVYIEYKGKLVLISDPSGWVF
jgi:hypothetical protein